MNLRAYFFVWLLLLTSCTTGQIIPPSHPTEIGPEEQWIEVDLLHQMVRLHEGNEMIGEYLAATGVNTAPETTTYTGLFRVQQMIKGPIMTVPGVYVTDVIIFDLSHGNGIHSQPKDAEGNLLDETLGRPATAGCVRVGESVTVFDFAELGMKVWVH